jgi:hypothetical protein
MTSPDGINWTFRQTPGSPQFSSVTYGNGLFVAVATAGVGNRVMTSPAPYSGDSDIGELTRMIADLQGAAVTRDVLETAVQDAQMAVMTPDYANMESANRITANNGTWTADRSGFVIIGGTVGYSGQGAAQTICSIQINNKEAYSDSANLTSSESAAFKTTLPVKTGDTVRILITNGNASVACYFVPPVASPAPIINSDYSASEIATGKTWTDGKMIYRRVFTGTSSATSGAQVSVGSIGTYGEIVSLSGFIVRNNNSRIPIGYADGQLYVEGYVAGSGAIMFAWFFAGDTTFASRPMTAIVEYTKP